MPRLTHLGAQGELAPISALVSPGMEVGAGSLSTRLLELKLQVTLEIGCLQHITNISLSPALSCNYAVLSDISGAVGTQAARALPPDVTELLGFL